MMTRDEFNKILCKKLSGLPEDDIKKSVEYYNEMIDDRMEDGLSEESAVAAISSTDEIMSEILADTALSKIIKQKVALRRSLRIWEIVLLITGSPLWLSILIAISAIVLSIYIVLWAVVIVFYAAVLSFAVGTIAGIALLVFFALKNNIIQGVFLAACGIICAGLAIIMFFISNRIAKCVVILGKKMLLAIKLCFIGKGRTK